MTNTSADDRGYSQTENGLHGNEHCRNVERLEEDLGGLFTVLSRIQRRLGEQHGMLRIGKSGDSIIIKQAVRYLFGCRSQLILRIDVGPDLLHVIPILHDAVLHGMSDVQQAAVLLRLRADEDVSFQAAGHHSDVLRTPDVIRKVDLRNRITGKAGFDHARPIVDHNRLIRNQDFVIHRGRAVFLVGEVNNDVGASDCFFSRCFYAALCKK